MTLPARLHQRLDAIVHSLQTSGNARALLALGSVGIEQGRLDAYSDLNFFVIAKKGMKEALVADLAWLSSVALAQELIAEKV
ncbi:MAG: hypothetical protein PHP42_04315 [Bacteroidota bacterium]|nr:hypothetical protein [Bacteroidota bacterium]